MESLDAFSGESANTTGEGGKSGKYPTRPMRAEFADEQVTFLGMPEHKTHYYTDEEKAAHAVDFEEGLLTQGAKRMDTKGAPRPRANAPGGRFNFVMDGDGDFTAANTISEFFKDSEGKTNRIHHSSLAQGDAVAAAGELEVVNGHLRTISNNSGHYFPTGEMTFNAVSELQEQGVLLDTTPDAEGYPINKPTKVELVGDSEKNTANITLTSQQFLQTQGNEEQIRAKAHLNKTIQTMFGNDANDSAVVEWLRLRQEHLHNQSNQANPQQNHGNVPEGDLHHEAEATSGNFLPFDAVGENVPRGCDHQDTGSTDWNSLDSHPSEGNAPFGYLHQQTQPTSENTYLFSDSPAGNAPGGYLHQEAQSTSENTYLFSDSPAGNAPVGYLNQETQSTSENAYLYSDSWEVTGTGT